MSSRRGHMKIPRLRRKAELLSAAPQLAAILDGESDAAGPVYIKGSPGSAGARRNPTGTRDTAAHLFDEEITEEDQLMREMEAVKRERASLMASLAALKGDTGKAGGELQQDDISHLRRDLELKQLKLNELKEEGRSLESEVQRMSTTVHDCTLLMPDGRPDDLASIAAVAATLSRVDADVNDAEAKNQLYTLLRERTKAGHLEMSLKVRAARELREDCVEDLATLTAAMHEQRALREDAEVQLAREREVAEGIRADWQRKLADRRKEVRDIERRQEAEREREERKVAKEAQNQTAEGIKAAQLWAALDAEAAAAEALAPQLASLQARWDLLHGVSGATTAEELIAFWQGLKEKEEGMRELVRRAEAREAAAKQLLAELLSERLQLVQVSTQDTGEEGEVEAIEQQIQEAHLTTEEARHKYGHLRSTCISAYQGLKAMQRRMDGAVKPNRLPRLSGGVSRPRVSRPSGTPPAGRRSSGTTAVAVPASLAAAPAGDHNILSSLPALIQDVAGSMKALVELESLAPRRSTSRSSGHPGYGAVEAPAALPNRSKGDKVVGPPAVDLDRIMGYHSDEDSGGGSAKSSGAESEADVAGAPLGSGGIMDRDAIKLRTMKITYKRPERSKV